MKNTLDILFGTIEEIRSVNTSIFSDILCEENKGTKQEICVRKHNWLILYSVTKIEKVTSNILSDFVPRKIHHFVLYCYSTFVISELSHTEIFPERNYKPLNKRGRSRTFFYFL